MKSVTSRRLSNLNKHLTSSSNINLPGPPVEDSKAYNLGTHHYISNLHSQYGDRFQITRNSNQVVFVRDFKAIRHVLLNEDFAKTWNVSVPSAANVDYVMNLVQPMLKNTVFNMNVETSTTSSPREAALNARRQLRPLFIAEDAFVSGVTRVIEDALNVWKEQAIHNQDNVVDVLELCHDVVRRAVLVFICGEMAEEANAMSSDIFDSVMHYFVNRYGQDHFNKNITKEDEQQMETLLHIGKKIVVEYRQKRALNLLGRRATTYHDRCALEIMMASGDHSDDVCAATLVNIVIAGAEAPASALGQLLQELGYQSEMYQHLKEDGCTATQRYTTKVVLEGLRLFAPATLVQRQALIDTVLPGNVFIPKGTVIGICAPAVHQTWENGTAFNPNRSDMDIAALLSGGPQISLLSFSGGPRGCPGRHLAMMTMKLVLSNIVQKFNLLPVPIKNNQSTQSTQSTQQHSKRYEWSPNVIGNGAAVRKFAEWPVNGIHMRLIPRSMKTILGCVLIPSDFVMRDEAPLLINRFTDVEMKYYTVPLDSEQINKSTYLRAYKKGALRRAAAALSTSTIIGLSCTSFSFSVGIENVRNEFVKGSGGRLQKTTDMATAQIEGIRAVGGQNCKVALLTPYIEELSKSNADTLENAGFEVVSRLTMHLERDELTTQIEPKEIMKWAKRVNCKECDCVVIGCSAFRACQPNFLDDLEKVLGKPVVTSTQSFLWKMLRGSGRMEQIDGYGKLFKEC